MLEVLHLRESEPCPSPLGQCEQLARWPVEAPESACDVRLLRGEVSAPSTLSAFPDHDRILTVTGGAGLVLEHGEADRASLRPLEPYRFDGGWSTTVGPARGPVRVLDVLARRALQRVEVQAVRLGRRRLREVLGRGQAFVLALVGPATVRVTDAEEAFSLDVEETLWLRDVAGGEELDITGEAEGCVVLLVRLEAR